MSEITNHYPDKSAQRLIVVIAMVQAVMLLVAHFAIENDGWLNQTPLRLTLWYSLTLVVPTSLMLLVSQAKQGLAWLFALGIAAIVALQASVAGNNCQPDIAVGCDSVLFPFSLALAVASFISVPFLQAWLQTGRPSRNYQLLFEYSWHNMLSLQLSGLFLGLFWLLLLLWAGLFSLLDIDLFADLFQEELFAYPVSGLIFGIGLSISRTRMELLANVRENSLFWVFKTLMPLLSIITVLFLVAIAISGVETLWGTGSAGNLLAWLALALIIFINAVFLNGNEVSHYPKAIRGLVNLALLGLPIIAALGLWAIALRVEQHGWSVVRLWALYVMLLLFVYGLGYAIAVALPAKLRGGVWLGSIKGHNTAVALAVIISLGAINLGLPNFYQIATDSQLKRLSDGEIEWQDFDFEHLRFDAGLSGFRAVEDFAANPTVELSEHGRTYLSALLAAENSWEVDVDVMSDESKMGAIISSPGVIVPEGLKAAILQHSYVVEYCVTDSNRCGVVPVQLSRNGQQDWLFIYENGDYSDLVIYRNSENGWQPVTTLSGTADGETLFDSIMSGDFQVVEPQWLDIEVGGQRFHSSD